MVIKGGFSGARLGGIQPYQYDPHSFSLYLPKGYEVTEPSADYTAIIGPQDNVGGHPGGAYMFFEPAKGTLLGA